MSIRKLSRAIAQEVLLPSVIAIVGLGMIHHPMILSGMAAVQTDLGDTRLIHYLLEHSYCWARSVPSDRDFWSPPFFYPARNVTAYSDALITVAPPYWLFRVAGAAPDTAFQFWMIGMSAINFLSAYLLFRRGIGLPSFPAAAGAFLIAFGASRVNQLGHQQLLPCFFSLIVIYGLIRVFTGRPKSLPHRLLWWLVSALALAAQLYAGFYLGWFLLLAIAVAAVWSMLLPSRRWTLLTVLGEDLLPIAASGVVAGVVLLPFFRHYSAAAREIGSRDYFLTRQFILLPWSWIYEGPHHWIWGGLAQVGPFRGLSREVEHRIGLGLVTPVVCALGLFLARDRPLCRLSGIVAGTLILLSTSLPGTQIADLGLVAIVLIASGTLHGEGRQPAKLAPLVILWCWFLSIRFPSWRVVVLGFLAVEACLAECFRLRTARHGTARHGTARHGTARHGTARHGTARHGTARHGTARQLALPLTLMAITCFKLFDAAAMALGFALIVPCIVAAAVLRIPDRGLACLVGLSAWFVLLAVITYSPMPETLVVGAITSISFLPVVGAKCRRFTASLPATLIIGAMVTLLVFQEHDVLWIYVFRYVPGASAIRAVSRLALLLLVPAALGLASFLAAPWSKKRPALAGAIVLFCLLEQGLTTPTFDKYAERARIRALANRVDREAHAFYYFRRSGDPGSWIYHLDAMWASRLSGVPTINGYTGGVPRGWGRFNLADVKGGLPIEDAFHSWIRLHGIPANKAILISDP